MIHFYFVQYGNKSIHYFLLKQIDPPLIAKNRCTGIAVSLIPLLKLSFYITAKC